MMGTIIKQEILNPKTRSRVRLFLGIIYRRAVRYKQWAFYRNRFALKRDQSDCFEFCVTGHHTPLIRQLPRADMRLQYNKIDNLNIAARKLDCMVVKPREIFSFWRAIGKPTRRKGYVEGMVLRNGRVVPGIGGGLCQLSNLIYWMTIHMSLTVIERWRHSYDVFPDVNPNQPFGSGTTASYNYIDLQIKNDTTRFCFACLSDGKPSSWLVEIKQAIAIQI